METKIEWGAKPFAFGPDDFPRLWEHLTDEANQEEFGKFLKYHQDFCKNETTTS